MGWDACGNSGIRGWNTARGEVAVSLSTCLLDEELLFFGGSGVGDGLEARSRSLHRFSG